MLHSIKAVGVIFTALIFLGCIAINYVSKPCKLFRIVDAYHAFTPAVRGLCQENHKLNSVTEQNRMLNYDIQRYIEIYRAYDKSSEYMGLSKKIFWK